MISPRLLTGAKTPERVATTTAASPERMRRHSWARSLSLKRGVQDRHAFGEALVELAGDGGREADFGNQHQRAAA